MAGATAIFEQAQAVASKDKQAGINMFEKIVEIPEGDVKNDEQIRAKEQAILQLGQLFSHSGRAVDLGHLIKHVRPFLNHISKSKASKLVRNLVDLFLDMEADTGMELELCEECIEWAKKEKRMFLRQALEVRLMALFFDTKMYTKALQLGHALLKELSKLEDKILLIDVHLLESRIYLSIENLPKAKTSLTSARITATTIYCPPKLQAALDLQSGILHAAIDQDFKTAYSYFCEAFEGLDAIDSRKALPALKYMLLCKIRLNLPKEVNAITTGKAALKHAGSDMDAMKAIAQATVNQSLSDFESNLTRYENELVNDPVIKSHLNDLYDNMLEQNLLRIIEPYSRVQIIHVAEVIGLKQNIVEAKLSQMILDKKLCGILDQENGVVIVLDEIGPCKSYDSALEIIRFIGKIVDNLYLKATKLP